MKSNSQHVPCLSCETGSLETKFEPYFVSVSEQQTVASDPVRFMKCTQCQDVILHGGESAKADFSAGKNLLKSVVRQEVTLNG